MKRLDISGQRFGRWLAISRAAPSYWVCRCDCGSVKAVYLGHLRSGRSVSCGCYNREVCRGPKPGRRGGPSRAPNYEVWRHMLARCENPRTTSFKNYGARGITVCDSWHSFEQFDKDMGPRPAGTSLDRIDNRAGYSPVNCRWATPAQQSRNRRSVVPLTILGETKAANEWSSKYGYPNHVSTILKRVRAGWDHAFAVFLPSERRAS